MRPSMSIRKYLARNMRSAFLSQLISSMSRHNRRVPTSFYYRFAVDARKFANKHAKGKLISVLEGGYSDRALTSGGMAHLSGLIDTEAIGAQVNEEWWNVTNLSLVADFWLSSLGDS